MNENEKQLHTVLNVLDREGILHNVILIGSWCLLFYKTIFDNFEATVRTFDIDFYIPDVKAVNEKNGIIDSLREINFDVIHDTLTHKSVFISPNGFELEFLTKLNRKQLSCVKVGNTGIYAESLSYVDIFTSNYIEINFDGLNVKVASPASYVLQKLLINDRRGDKQDKDIQSIKHVLNYIHISKKYTDNLEHLFSSLPTKWKKKIEKTASSFNIELFK